MATANFAVLFLSESLLTQVINFKGTLIVIIIVIENLQSPKKGVPS